MDDFVRPKKPSSRAKTWVPNRAVMGARGRSKRSPSRRRPACSMARRVSRSSRKAAIGRSATIRSNPSSAESGAIFGPANRAKAQAASGVEATAPNAVKPWPARPPSILSRSPASPSKRWATPVMSRKTPSSPSSADSGVNLRHQSTIWVAVAASAAGSASATSRAGHMARASASVRPGLMPIAAA